MRVSRAEFLHVLESVQPGLTTRDVMEQSSCFAFLGKEVATYNDEISCRRKSPIKIEGAVQATPLLSVLRKMTEEEIELEVTGEEFIVKGKRRRAGIRMEKDVMLALKNVEDPGEWRKCHSDLSEALHIVQQCAGTKIEREEGFAMTCVHITPKYVEACDNLQAVRYKVKTRIAEDTIVRAASIRQVTSFDMTELSETDAWLHFRNPAGLMFSCRRYVGEEASYEDLGTILSVSGDKLVLPKGLAEAADKAAIFSAENVEDNEVLVELSPGKLRIKGEGTSGWFSETKKLKYKGRSLAFRIPPGLLQELTKRHNECEVTEKALKVDGGKFIYCTSLSIANGEKKEETEE